LMVAPSIFIYCLNIPDADDAIRLSCIIFLLHIITFISVTVRRLHDTNRSGWWYFFLHLLGPLGIAVIAYFCVQDSYFNYNQWGPVPKQISDEGLYKT
jgi:uncharacterized membrane protein YhaH (DUF805 family)